jgi:hypothetical protein
MQTSARLILAGLIITAVGCASKKPPPPPSFWQYRQADFATAPGVPLYAMVSMPEGFAPDRSAAPIWLGGGIEVALIGTYQGGPAIVGFSGTQFADYRILASEQTSEHSKKRILDAAASPDGSALLVAAARADRSGIDLSTRYMSAPDRSSVLATVKGDFDSASVAWFAHNEMVLTARGTARDDLPVETTIYAFNSAGKQIAKKKTTRCDLSLAFWNLSGTLAFVPTKPGAAATLFDRRKGKCSELLIPGNVRFIQWSPDDQSFLYVAALAGASGAGGFAAFDYDLASDASRMVAMSSGAVAFTDSGAVAALGNRKLTNRAISRLPYESIPLEIALLNLGSGETQITALPLQATPEAMTSSAIHYSAAASSLAFELPVASTQGGVDIGTFDLRSKTTGLLARTLRSSNPPPLSWSPDGALLALVKIDSWPSAAAPGFFPADSTRTAPDLSLVASQPTLAILGLPRPSTP